LEPVVFAGVSPSFARKFELVLWRFGGQVDMVAAENDTGAMDENTAASWASIKKIH
jgi:hypothetical protein